MVELEFEEWQGYKAALWSHSKKGRSVERMEIMTRVVYASGEGYEKRHIVIDHISDVLWSKKESMATLLNCNT